MHIDTFSVTEPNHILNVVYDIGNLGYCPFIFIIGAAFYCVNISGTVIGDSLSTSGIYVAKLDEAPSVMQDIMAIRENPQSNIRIKIRLSQGIGFLGIVPLRIKNTNLIRYYESVS